ncbi:MAG: serine hydrolase domain-containing protein [Anaerolineales bacterium]
MAQNQPDPNVVSNQDITAEAVEHFISSYLGAKMESAHAPGVAVVVVSQGEVVFESGFGFADLETQTPMTADTPVRAGSVSKPVTSTAVMQLVEQGRLDLDAPISKYIDDVDFDDRYDHASTVSQLLTLTGGYPDQLVGSHAVDAASWLPLGEYLATRMAPRVNPPGTVLSYTSLEHSLLAYAVEKVSGRAYPQVFEDTLFEPLGMSQTTYQQPLPEPIQAGMAAGYLFDGGQYQEVPMDFVHQSGGIALVTTAADMGRYMLALLNGGELDGVRVLSQETVEQILTRQASAHEFSRGRTYGFTEINFSGRQVLYHDGNGIGFANRMVLSPEHDFGMFVTVNHRALNKAAKSADAYDMIKGLSTEVLKTFLPESPVESVSGLERMPDAAERAAEYAGHYQLAGTAPTDFFRVNALLDNVDVGDNRDGSITIGSNRYEEVEPGLFRSLSAPNFFVVFTEDETGAARYLTFGGTGSYKKVPGYQSLNTQLGVVGGMLLVFLSMTIVWPFTRYGSIVFWLVSLLNLVFFVGFALIMTQADIVQFFKTIPFGAKLVFAIPWISGALSLSLPFLLALVWKDAAVPLLGRLHSSLTTAASFIFIWFTYFWRLFL